MADFTVFDAVKDHLVLEDATPEVRDTAISAFDSNPENKKLLENGTGTC